MQHIFLVHYWFIQNVVSLPIRRNQVHHFLIPLSFSLQKVEGLSFGPTSSKLMLSLNTNQEMRNELNLDMFQVAHQLNLRPFRI
jgi:hypothetical protein